jgi:16S rRNA (guanine527-N7)-methyltransferase
LTDSQIKRRLADLVERWGLEPDAGQMLTRLLEALAADARAPTTVSDPPAAVDVHLADSLSGLQVLSDRTFGRIVDIGSGAGFPGLALAIALPETRIDLLEASGRKCEFLERVTGVTGVQNARVVCGRAEEWAAAEGARAYTGAVVRALGSLSTVIEYAAPLLRLGGSLVAWKGRRDPFEESDAELASATLGLRLVTVEHVDPYPSSRARHLHVYEKVEETPPCFPRRPGMARKRPIGQRGKGKA